MPLSAAEIRHVARLARIGLRDDEIEGFARDVGSILEHIGRIGELDLEGVPPTSHPLDLENRLGEDEPRPSTPRAVLLACAPDPAPDGFRVPPTGA